MARDRSSVLLCSGSEDCDDCHIIDDNQVFNLRKFINNNSGSLRKPQESILERFDRLAEAYIDRRKGNIGIVSSLESVRRKARIDETSTMTDHDSPKLISRTLANSMSNIDVTEELDLEETNELSEAMESLLRAEEAVRFTETIVAAEAAVATVPPELAEEAALAVAQDYQTKKIYTINEEIPGDTMIEVLGYLGITGANKKHSNLFCHC